MFKVILVAPRSMSDMNLVAKKMKKILSNKGDDVQIVYPYTMGPRKVGHKYAVWKNLASKKFSADWDRFGKQADDFRNCSMAQYADALVAFWDGEDDTIRNIISHMKNLKKPIRIIKV